MEPKNEHGVSRDDARARSASIAKIASAASKYDKASSRVSQPSTPEGVDFIGAYDAYSEAIFRHCYFRIFDRERAKELMQETFTRTWEYLAQDKEVKNLRAFLYKVANNLIIDNSRKKKEFSLDELREKGFEPGIEEEAKIQNSIDSQVVLVALKKLDRKYRDVIAMRYIDEFSPKEIAALLGEKENVISVRIHRGLKLLRKFIK